MSATLSPKTLKPLLRADAAVRVGDAGVRFEVDRQAADTINNVGGDQYNEHRYQMVIEPMRRRARVLLRLGNSLFLAALAAQLTVMVLFGSKIGDFIDTVRPAIDAKSTGELGSLPFGLLLVIPAAAVVGFVGLVLILSSVTMRRRARREVEAL
jgi:hypothetical protein